MSTVVPQTVTMPNNDETKVRTKPHRIRRSVSPTLKRGAMLQTLAALIWLPQAALIALAINQLADSGFSNNIYYFAAGIFLLGVLRAGLDRAGATKAFEAARAELTRLRDGAIVALTKRSPLDPTRPLSGEAASVLAEQAEMVVPYFSRFVPVRMRLMIVPLFILIAVFWFSWVAAMILLIAAPLIPLFMALIGMKAQSASEQHLNELGGMNGFLLDRLRGLATIRTFGAVDATALRLRANAEELRKKTMAVLRIAFMSSAVLELFSALGVAMVAVYTGFHFLGQLEFGAWGQKLSLGEGLFILLLAPAFFEPLRDLSAVWHDRAAGEAAISALEKLAEPNMQIAGSKPARPVDVHKSASASVFMREVNLAYVPDRPILTGFNLAIDAGEHVALLAPSGGGKSTILSLIAGLIEPQSGSISIGNTSLSDATADNLRQHIGWIGQNPHVFTGSARQNITLGRDISTEAVHAAVDQMMLGQVKGVKDNQLIGEKGAGLSGGEALRLALARVAVAQDIDLILADEPTAHLDKITAEQAGAAILNFAKGKTLIVATHDEALANKMDRIIRLDEPDSVEWQRSAAE